jgi:hypothetical protein
MKSLAAFLALLVAPLAGCTVQTLDFQSSAEAENRCESSADCSAGVCDPELRICRAPAGGLGTVLFRISPTSESKQYSLLSFIDVQSAIPLEGGALDLDVPEPAEFTGEVKLPPDVSCAGYGSNASPTIPVRVVFRPSERVFGLATADQAFDTQAVTRLGEPYQFGARLSPGDYDVYIRPDPTESYEGSCAVAPTVIRRWQSPVGKLTAPGDDQPVPFYLSPPRKLSVSVQWPISVDGNSAEALQGWKVDLIDPLTGWALSAPTPLALELLPDAGSVRYVADVLFSELPDPDARGKELVRLTPPEGVTAPSFVIERWAIEGLSADTARIESIQSLPTPVRVGGAVVVNDAEGQNPVASGDLTLRFVSENPPVYFSAVTEYRDGKFEVDLLPGVYEVYAIPSASGTQQSYAVTRTTLEVSDQLVQQHGKSVRIDPTSRLSGVALGPSGQAVIGARVSAIASPEPPGRVWTALGLSRPKPLAVDGTVGPTGTFAMDVHPGALNVSIRPDTSTGFAWLSRPNVLVQEGIHDLGTLPLPPPVVYEGFVAGAHPLGSALIEAYVFLDAQGYTDERGGARSVVQVAETRADELGRFRLLLPANLN